MSQREILKDAVLLALKTEGGRLRPRKAGVSRIWKRLGSRYFSRTFRKRCSIVYILILGQGDLC